MSTIRPSKLRKIIDQFSDPTILVIGDVILDSYVWGKVERICPEAPVPVVEVQKETYMLGGAANVVRNLRTLGADVYLSGVVGSDYPSKIIYEELESIHVNAEGLVSDNNRPTTKKTRVVAGHQQVVRFDHETKAVISEETFQKHLAFIQKNWECFDAIIVSDYGKGLVTEALLKELRKLQAKNKKWISVDPKERNMPYYKGVSLVTPNQKEAAFAAGKQIETEQDLKEVGRKIMHQLGCENLVVTLGSQGMALFQKGGEFLKVPTFAKEVFDVSGAGDTVIATLTLAVSCGATLSEAVALANYAAGVVVGKLGTAAVSAMELKKYIETEKNRVSKRHLTYQSPLPSRLSS
ncbi:MAG: hypothetical protein A3B70_07050 [Deltaproteobacteria bacterium RIFCSPHIGHO2_02_FULL_40_11]|nr:MAG: hypothetical protein A3B70_07050 [Deltaproteobacteria bacterium RIFCSPHIGHO2_02_FULL_40_11]